MAIARALIPGPALIVADEPVSMVDASLRMAIVNLFKTLRDDLGVSIIYITHDLATAYYISDRIIIMQKGKVVESGDGAGGARPPEASLTRSCSSRRCSRRTPRLKELPPAEPAIIHRPLKAGHIKPRGDGNA